MEKIDRLPFGRLGLLTDSGTEDCMNVCHPEGCVIS